MTSSTLGPGSYAGDSASVSTLIHRSLFVACISFKAFGDALQLTSLDNVKYILMGIDVFLLYAEYHPEKNRRFSDGLKNVNLICLTFVFASCIAILHTQTFSAQTLKELFYLWIPAVYAFLLLNVLSRREIDLYFNIMLILFIAAYLVEISRVTKFSIENLKKISYSNSYSPFESSDMSGPAIYLFFYFFSRRNAGYRKWISFLFVLFTFKRLAVAAAVLLFVLQKFMNLNRQVSKRTAALFQLFFLAAPVLVYFFLRPDYILALDQTFHIDLDRFLMGRASIFDYVLGTGFHSFGYGSTTVIVLQSPYREAENMHLDLVKILMETSPVGLVVFVHCMWNLAGRKMFHVILFLLSFLNMLTSHMLSNPFSWIMIYLIIGGQTEETFSREGKEDEPMQRQTSAQPDQHLRPDLQR